MWINVTIKIIGYYECDLKQSEWSKRHAYLHRRYWKTCSFNAAAVAATDAFIVSYSLYYYYYDSVPLTHSLHTLTRSIGMLAAPCTRSHSLPSPFWFLFYFISILIDCKRNLLFVRCWFFNEYVRWLYTLEMFPSSIFNSLCFIGSSSVFWVGEWFCVAGFCYSLCLHQHNRTHNHTHSSTTYNCIVAFMAAFSFSPLSTYVFVLKNKPQQFVVVVILWLWASPDIYFDLYELFRTGIKRSILADCYKHIIFDNCIHDYRRILTCIHFKQLVDGWGRKNARAHTHNFTNYLHFSVRVFAGVARSHFDENCFLYGLVVYVRK